jgi:hypothetical protein
VHRSTCFAPAAAHPNRKLELQDFTAAWQAAKRTAHGSRGVRSLAGRIHPHEVSMD